MLTIGYIGNGKSANRYHLPFASLNPHVRVKTVYAPVVDHTWDPVEGVTYTDRIDQLLGDPEIALVVVCTPADSHVQNATAVLRAGKHALVEKPFAPSAQEARQVFDLARDNGLFVQCYQNRRFDSDYLTVQKVIQSGVLGDLLEVEMHYDYYRPEVPTSKNTEFTRARSYLFGHGTHTVDQVVGYFGAPDHVHYDVRQLLGPGRMNDYFDLDFFYGQLKVSVKSSYFRVKARPSFVLHGKKGRFVKESKDRQEEHLKLFYLPGSPDFGVDLPEHYGTLTYYDDAGVYHEESVVSEVGGYGRMYEAVYQSIAHGAPKAVQDEDTIRQLEILEAGIGLIEASEQRR
ncbi:Gfo/Idh/MocA family oxidoreductase [Cellulomonas hominis]